MNSVQKFGEVFTPKDIVDKLLENIDYSNGDLKIVEPSFGDGRILMEVKSRLSKYHSDEHIMTNMLYGVEIQEAWHHEAVERLNPHGYNHNLLCCSALNFEGIFNPLKDWINKFDLVVGNPP